jgi:hypothetical protein
MLGFLSTLATPRVPRLSCPPSVAFDCSVGFVLLVNAFVFAFAPHVFYFLFSFCKCCETVIGRSFAYLSANNFSLLTFIGKYCHVHGNTAVKSLCTFSFLVFFNPRVKLNSEKERQKLRLFFLRVPLQSNTPTPVSIFFS